MPSTLLQIARGAASGFAGRQQDAIEKNRRDLAEALELADRQGITLEDPTPAVAPPAPPAGPVIPGPAGSPVAHSAIMQAAHDAFKTTPTGKLGEPAAPAAPAAPAPRNVMKIAQVTLAGQKKDVVLDPSQTAGGKRRAAEKSNQAAFDRLNTTGQMGAYEPTFDYVGKERTDLDENETIASLVKAGVDPEEAKLLAKHKIDVDLRRDRKGALDERIRHDHAMENRATAARTSQTRQELASVNTQIDDTARDLAAAKKGANPGMVLQNVDPKAYDDSVSNVRARVGKLQARADSLRNVGDSLSAIVQGRTKAPAKGTGSSSTGSGAKKPKLSPGTAVSNADLDAALDANGGDVKKARAWLSAQGKK